MAKAFALFVCATLFAGCRARTGAALDPDRILHMAGEEAGQINAPKERLTRQLNIANRQTENGHAADARKTLAEARSTIEHADKNALTDHERLAGWISLSELARNADDKPFANGALDQALASLDNLTPAQARCEYVLGVEREVKILRGDAPAAKLLVTASEWAMELPQQTMRRSAYVAFANALFHCNDYEAARTVLRHDPDAAWRSDSLTALSDRARRENPAQGSWLSQRVTFYAAGVKSAAAPAEGPPSSLLDAATTSEPSLRESFGKPLDFKSNYYRAR
ncbi:MAG: hypothetical protein JWN40_4650 [Phycisphaerales bacterium]|nr:hypothetical protein [Phycisphaerales bacterium]